MKNTLLFILLFFFFQSFSQNSPDLKKDADKLFKNEQYSEAYKLYAQLVANYPKDPEYNYRLGVCMIYGEPDKKKCLPYLKMAVSNPAEAPKEALFYLGKGYHVNYRFNEALKNYNDFKSTAPASLQKKLQVDREISACMNGKQLLSNLTDLVVLNKKELPEADYFRSYQLNMGGKLLVKPDEFKTGTDKKKKEKSVVFLQTGSDVVYFSSYGDNAETGKDIYISRRLPTGTYSKPEKVSGINSPFDDDYPFLHPDGKSLYFASKGHNSMGGYDIFKSVLNEENNTWGPPVNLEFPINSPDDDFLFVTDSLETFAYFSTGRQSAPGKIDVLKVKTKRKPIDIVAVKGTVIKGQVDHSLASVITVQELFSGDEIGVFEADEEGSYMLELPNAGKLVFTVETPGMETQTSQVTLPSNEKLKPYRQTITYEEGKLKILNYFDEPVNGDSYLNYLNVIEKKAKLEVNETEAGEPVATQNTETKPTPQIISEEKTDPKSGLDNKQLASAARKDATQSRAESAQLSRDSKDALDIGTKKKKEAEKKLAAAEEKIKQAENISNEEEKNTALEEANKEKQNAESDLAVAAKILTFGETLSEDAKSKEQKAALQQKYAEELDKAVSSTNGGSQDKLDALQKEIEDLSKNQNNSDNVVTELKTQISEKENKISSNEQTANIIKTNVEEIKTAINEKETELAQTKKKKAKKEIEDQIAALKTELSEKESQSSSNEAEIKTLNEELVGLRKELELTEKVKTVDVVSAPIEPQDFSNAGLKSAYKDRIAVDDPSDKSSLETSIAELNNYNKDIETAISKNKKELQATKNPAQKQKITTEIKALEKTKKENQTLISTNFNRITQINKIEQQDKVLPENNATYLPIAAVSPTEAITILDELSADLKEDEREVFETTIFMNPQAQSLKQEALASLKETEEKQTKLLEDITVSKDIIKTINTETVEPVLTAADLSKQADELSDLAQKKRTEASNAEGAKKTALIEEARSLEDQANDKNIRAADITRSDNALTVLNNKENIQNLLKENKASDEDAEAARKLSDEAVAAFRKANDIRQEARGQTNKGALLGNFSNAEEQEAEAISKQQQAIDILMRAAPDFSLKTVVTSTTPAEPVPPGPNLDSSLVAVNKGILEIADIKIVSYTKLYEANAAEIEMMNTDIKNNERFFTEVPDQKIELVSANKKIGFATKFYDDSKTAEKQNDKLNLLISAVKQQNLAIAQLTNINIALEKAASAPPKVAVEIVPPQQTNSTPTQTETVTQNTVTPETPTIAVQPEVTPEPTVVTQSPSAPVDTRTFDIALLAQKDTTTEDVINYLDTYEPTLKNADAQSTISTSLSKLKDIEARNRDLDAEIANSTSGGESTPIDPVATRKEAEKLLDEASLLMSDSEDAKDEAKDARGEERVALVAESKDLETRAKNKMFESASLTQRANESEYKANITAIDELIEKLKTDDPSMASEIENKRAEFEPVKSQIKNLRTDATTLTNDDARLGAIGNAEEKETELIKRQKELLATLTKKYPDYVIKPYIEKKPGSTEELQAKKSELKKDQYAELTSITNAYNLEYETSKNQVPAELSPEQQIVKDNADNLNAESKQLLIRSAGVEDEAEKTKMLSLSAKYANTAVLQLNKLLPGAVAVNPTPNTNTTSTEQTVANELEQIGNKINESNEPVATEPVTVVPTPAKTVTKPPVTTRVMKVEGLAILKTNAYSAAKPIPVDAKIQDGLVFRVQIGAFRTQIPNNAFKGLSPLNGETTPNGYIRYTAGNFDKIESANAVKNDLRGLGYNDAFVVVYYNGQRITIAQAMAMMQEQGITVDPDAPQSAGITANVNVPKAAANTGLQEMVTVTKELERINGLLYTIQIGVFTKQVTKTQLRGLRPIFSEQLPSGLYRYTAGIYSDTEKLLADKTKIVDLGVKDAFVSAYLNGKRIPFNEAKQQQSTDTTIRLEPENPVIFPGAAPLSVNPTVLSTETNNFPEGPVTPFTNDVLSYPVATPDNGVKTTQDGLSYKVQIGAYSKQVPEDVAQKFSAIRNWPIENKQTNSLFIYTVGNFSELKFAKELRDEIKALGINDAFITVYQDGRKLYGAEAEPFLR